MGLTLFVQIHLFLWSGWATQNLEGRTRSLRRRPRIIMFVERALSSVHVCREARGQVAQADARLLAPMYVTPGFVHVPCHKFHPGGRAEGTLDEPTSLLPVHVGVLKGAQCSLLNAYSLSQLMQQ